MCVTSVIGIAAIFSAELRKYIPPRISKYIHICGGTLTYAFGSVTLILSLYTGWFIRKTSETAQVICFIVLVIIFAWTLLNPLINIIKRSKKLF